ncbi:MAG: 23S rRNA (cytidine(2498)-2'-O)-methyltransferase RlmM, partial [Magnetococcales bacterium]|nr:23S rRNA (cytidine(2498)-2'-O)-methyltransferase RlmM [Magnetococcales bacterium]
VAGGGGRAEVVFLAGTRVMLGCSWPGRGALWPMGIPRLRLPGGSPSRAALKLEEAFCQLLTPRERRTRLTSGRTAVDLGAAPGGWSLVLLQDGLNVTAVDRAALSGVVTGYKGLRHVREDGFRFRPAKPVDWLFCDMVEQPGRIADLVGHWAVSGWCRGALFNLKLPMKKRLAELTHCQERILSTMEKAGIPCRLRFRHLYHDREEVTGLLLVAS